MTKNEKQARKIVRELLAAIFLCPTITPSEELWPAMKAANEWLAGERNEK